MPVVGRVEGNYEPLRVEEWVLSFWERENIYAKVKELERGRTKIFKFLDGPPYPSSAIPHAGTAWNKVLKDAVLRYKRMRGYRVTDTPGYDCHGLPIEVAVEKTLGVKVKREIEERIGVDKFIEKCKSLVKTNIEGLTKWFKRLGVFMDWENPYLTMKDEYIEAAWWLIKRAYDRGLLTRDLRIVYWCPRCGTTLAEYEVEYHNIDDPSIYVKFPVRGQDRTYLLIWTTTPWTLPANTFVMAHPEALYVKVRVGDEYLILAKARLKPVMEEAGVKEYEVIEEFPGKMLEGLEYRHPLEDVVPLQEKLRKYHKVVLSHEYVVLHEGTGLVHAAPGHGFEDFELARRIGVDFIASPLDDEGRFTSEVGPYSGLAAREANKQIIDDLRKRGALFYSTTVTHRYPVCWRCKTPVLLRATRQWIIAVSRLKDKLREELSRSEWIPGWAAKRTEAMLDNLQDWVLSRQRYWGTPLPIWVCRSCGNITVVGSVKELEELGGKRPKELHKPWIDEVKLRCPKCGGVMERVRDVADVWFDSGVAFYASRGHPDKAGVDPVVDFITEGHDQTRGWFFSLLRAGVIGFDRAPYRSVLVHGFMLDEKGREMHKSLGNYVGTDEIVEKMGSDVFRFWVLQNTTWEDARFSWRALEKARSDLVVAWNVYVFASTYMRLDKFDPEKYRLEDYSGHLRVEDKWLLSRLNTLIETVTDHMEKYHVHEALRALRSFIVEDLSHWYIRLIRRRVWVEEESPEKIAAYIVLYKALDAWLRMAAVFIPFFAEYVYQLFFRPALREAKESVHMLEWPSVEEKHIDKDLEEYMNVAREVVEAAAAARTEAGIKLRKPVRRLIVYTDDEKIRGAVEMLRDLIAFAANAREVLVKSVAEYEEIVRYKVEPVYSVLGPEFRGLTNAIIEYLRDNGDRVARDIIAKGYHEADVEGTKIRIERKHVAIIPSHIEGYIVKEIKGASVVLDTKLSEEEVAEGIARDLIRRIQYMRKLLGLEVDEYIDVVVYVPSQHMKYVRGKADYIAEEVRARTFSIVDTEAAVKNLGDALVREWEIEGEKYVIGVKRVSAG